MIGANNDVKTVSTRLGHSSVSLTLNVYADAIRKNDVSAAQSIAKILGPKGEADDEGQEAR